MVGLDAIAHHRRRSDAASAHAPWPLQGQARRQGRDADPRGARRLSEIGGAEGGLLAERSGIAFDEPGALEPPRPGRQFKNDLALADIPHQRKAWLKSQPGFEIK